MGFNCNNNNNDNTKVLIEHTTESQHGLQN